MTQGSNRWTFSLDVPRLKQLISSTIEARGESILNDEGVDRRVCDDLADEIVATVMGRFHLSLAVTLSDS